MFQKMSLWKSMLIAERDFDEGFSGFKSYHHSIVLWAVGNNYHRWPHTPILAPWLPSSALSLYSSLPPLTAREEWVAVGRGEGGHGAGLLAGALGAWWNRDAWGTLDLDLAGAARRHWPVRTGGAVGRCGHGKKQAMALVGEDRLGDRVRWWRWL
jgi:hypothetical protein